MVNSHPGNCIGVGDLYIVKIYKYPLPSFDCVIDMPKGAEVKCVEDQNGELTLWALVDEKADYVQRHFKVYATGSKIDEGAKYLGSVLQVGGAFVSHVFEIKLP